MALISEVGRKSFKNRAVMTAIYIILSMLGLTMVVPFLITITSSLSNTYDYNRFSPLPRYLWSTNDRFLKGLSNYFFNVQRWSQQFSAVAPTKPAHWTAWFIIGRDTDRMNEFSSYYLAHPNPTAAADYAEFCESYPIEDTTASMQTEYLISFLPRYYGKKYKALHPDSKLSGNALDRESIKILSQEWDVPFDSYFSTSLWQENNYPLDKRGWFSPDSAKFECFLAYKKAHKQHFFTPGISGKWRKFCKAHGLAEKPPFPVEDDAPQNIKDLWLQFKKEVAPVTTCMPYPMRVAWYNYLTSEEVAQLLQERKMDIDLYNDLANTHYEYLQETPFPIPASFPERIQKLWRNFLQERFPLRFVTIRDPKHLEPQFQEFVKNTVHFLEPLNSILGTNYKEWSELPLPAKAPTGNDAHAKGLQNLWRNFLNNVPIEELTFDCAEFSYQKFALAKYGSLEGINKAYGWNLKYIEEVFPPFMAAYVHTFQNHQYWLTFGPILKNYKLILNYLLFNGNAIMVTILLIMMTIALTITVNPLAAYALSRFRIRGHNQILIFMLATMAFPAMVSAIPAYLLMRDMGLLNTYWALVLPGAANGMSIFILKGFFDSLPMELFEAATIDGASEMQIFRIIAMPMVKPILAINCLHAFIGAYNGWQWALLICQKQSMWTIAVWMYQASTWWNSSPWIVSAGFVIVSIPTMLVFIFCQKIILRGIIIPSMK